jgi:hypothetical protein
VSHKVVCHGRNQLIEAIQRSDIRHRGKHAPHHVALRSDRRRIRVRIRHERGTAGGPCVAKRALDLSDRRAVHFDSGIAPGVLPLRGAAHPLARDAQARHKCDGAVDGDHLAVIARETPERAVQPGG